MEQDHLYVNDGPAMWRLLGGKVVSAGVDSIVEGQAHCAKEVATNSNCMHIWGANWWGEAVVARGDNGMGICLGYYSTVISPKIGSLSKISPPPFLNEVVAKDAFFFQ